MTPLAPVCDVCTGVSSCLSQVRSDWGTLLHRGFMVDLTVSTSCLQQKTCHSSGQKVRTIKTETAWGTQPLELRAAGVFPVKAINIEIRLNQENTRSSMNCLKIQTNSLHFLSIRLYIFLFNFFMFKFSQLFLWWFLFLHLILYFLVNRSCFLCDTLIIKLLIYWLC